MGGGSVRRTREPPIVTTVLRKSRVVTSGARAAHDLALLGRRRIRRLLGGLVGGPFVVAHVQNSLVSRVTMGPLGRFLGLACEPAWVGARQASVQRTGEPAANLTRPRPCAGRARSRRSRRRRRAAAWRPVRWSGR